MLDENEMGSLLRVERGTNGKVDIRLIIFGDLVGKAYLCCLKSKLCILLL